LLLSLFVFSCRSADTTKEDGDLTNEVRRLQRQIALAPNDVGVQRDLGVVYFKAKQYPAAKLYLYRSYLQAANDARTAFFYGMTLEQLGDPEGALRVYANYPDLSSEYQKLIEGRYHTLTKEAIQKQLLSLLKDEQKLGTERIAPNAVAVFPLRYQGTDSSFASLGLGISEMVIVDLFQVKSLQLVERIRIESLLDELKLGQSKNVDVSTAPRLGKLLGAGRLVSGSYDLSKARSLTVNVASWDAIKRESPKISTASDDLEDLFKIEKDIVFAILDGLGIKLTAQERNAIRQRVPTRNLQAFMLYCSGLARLDADDFKGAGQFFRQSLSLDPEFVPAKTRAGEAEARSVAGGPKENALAAANALESPSGVAQTPKKSGKLLAKRLQNLQNGIGSNFYPGQDDRDAAEDAARFDIVGSPIGLPPPPPQR
jgi:tetratricopeptide (TPR) repeat protein